MRGVVLGGDRVVILSAKSRKLAVEALRARAAARASDIMPIIEELRAEPFAGFALQ